MSSYEQHKTTWSETYISDPVQLLKLIAPVCDLISLYEGPSISRTEFNEVESKKHHARGSKNTFSFTCNQSETTVEFCYFQKGEKLVAIRIIQDAGTTVEINASLSPTVKDELKKIIQSEFQKYLSEQATNNSKNSLTDSQNNTNTENQTEQKSEGNKVRSETEILEFEIHQQHNFDRRLITEMNLICQLISDGEAPLLDESELEYELRAESHEEFYRLNKSNTSFEIRYENYSFDTGHWSSARGGHIEFTLKKNNHLLIRSTVQHHRLIIELDSNLKSKTGEIKSSLEGKFS